MGQDLFGLLQLVPVVALDACHLAADACSGEERRLLGVVAISRVVAAVSAQASREAPRVERIRGWKGGRSQEVAEVLESRVDR